MRLLNKVFLVAFVPTALAAAAMLGLTWRQNQQTVREHRRDETRAHFDALHQQVSSNFVGIRAVLAEEASRLLPGEPERVLEELRTLESRLGARVDGVFLDLPDGEVLGTHGERFSTRDRYYYPLLLQGTPVITQIVTSKASGRPSVIVIAPKTTERGEYLGAVAASVPVSELLQTIRNFSAGGDGIALLVDETGRVEASPIAPAVASQVIPRIVATDRGDTELQLSGIPNELLFTRIKGTPWKLALLQSQQDALLLQRQWLIVTALILVVTVAVGGFGRWLLQRLLARPVQRLIEAHAALAQGADAIRVEPDHHDEFAELATSFNHMAEQLQRTQDELRHHERVQAAIVANIPGMVFRFVARRDGTMGLPFVGERSEELIGLAPTPYETYFERFMARLEPEQRRLFLASAEAAVRDQNPWSYEGALQSPTGEKKWFHALSRPTAVGEEVVFDGVLLDVTERRRAEEALRQSEERFRLLLQNSNDLIAILDGEGRLLLLNGPVESVLGYRPEELAASDAFALVHPDDDGELRRAFAEALADPGHPRRIEYRLRRKDGSWLWIEAVGSNLLNDQAVRGIVLNLRDISSRKQAEEERERLQSQLTQAQKMESVGRLAGGVAHDFNNMLGVILGHTELAMASVDPAQPLYADLQEIRGAAERSAELTRQLLTFARKQAIAPKVLDLNETVDGMLKMLRRLIGEDIQLAWLPGREAVRVRIDPSQVDQILANLCVNARDALSGNGRVTIETGVAVFDEHYCSLHADVTAGQYVLLAVSDDGCGMDAETRSHLFEPFFTTKSLGKGTGLGLATVFGIVRQNNGFISVYSEVGRGTTFKIYLPRHASEAALPAQRQLASVQPKGETVLVVEDEPALRLVTAGMLRRLGYVVMTATTPAEALLLASEHTGPVDVLLTDVVMPEMNGRLLADRLLELHPHLRCLFMSGYTADVIAHHGVLDEGVHFLQKPFSTATLAAKLREVLGHR